MKKITIIAVFVISIITAGIAQQTNTVKSTGNGPSDSREKVQFGIKAGLNCSNVYDAQGEEFKADRKFGLAGGAFITIPIGKFLGIQPEVLISQKGFQGQGVIQSSIYSFTRTTTYIDVPLLFALKPSRFFTILAGPEYSFLIHQKDVFANSNATIEQEQEFQNDNIRKNIFGFVGGMDINLRHLVLGSRIGWDVQNNNGDGTSSTPRYKNVWFQGTIGYKIL